MNDLMKAYELCRDVTEENGKTYALATRLLPWRRRLAIWALYAWARCIDDYVDLDDGSVSPVRDAEAVEQRVQSLNEALHQTLHDGSVPESVLTEFGEKEHHILAATAHTLREWSISTELTDAFLESMLMDIPGTGGHVSHFRTWEQLDSYMWGSASVIGLEVLPILGTRASVSRDDAAPYAAELGRAFQVTNFLRDVSEDLQRDRVYLPLDEWEAFGVDEDRLRYCHAHGCADARVRSAIAHFIAVNQSMYRTAEKGIDMLAVPSRQAIRTASVLYSDILDEIVKANYDVFAGRAIVPQLRKMEVAVTNGAAGMLLWIAGRPQKRLRALTAQTK